MLLSFPEQKKAKTSKHLDLFSRLSGRSRGFGAFANLITVATLDLHRLVVKKNERKMFDF